MAGTRPIFVDEDFYEILSKRVIRNRKSCNLIKKRTGDPNFFETYGDATKSIAKELRRIWR